MSYPINYPTPQGANVQIFKEGGSTSDWVKPQGASFVWFTLIGAGGGGGIGSASVGGGGGGSGSVTNCMIPAFLIPDTLRVTVGFGGSSGIAGTASTIIYQQKDGTGYTLLTGNGGSSGTSNATAGAAGTASTSNFFSCAGFFQSIAGQAGTNGSSVSAPDLAASTTTFLSGGAGGSGSNTVGGGSVTPNYGYPSTAGSGALITPPKNGYFIQQPIIVGCGGAGAYYDGSTGGVGANGGLGCGGGGSGRSSASGTKGGDGLVVIITW